MDKVVLNNESCTFSNSSAARFCFQKIALLWPGHVDSVKCLFMRNKRHSVVSVIDTEQKKRKPNSFVLDLSNSY